MAEQITHVDAPESRVLAGVARCDVTPPVGMYHRMWGAATHDRSTGIHRPLLATALWIAPTNSNSGRAVIALDHCLLWHEEMNALLDAIVAGAGIAREQAIVFFSHTHGSGLMGKERTLLPGGDLIMPYLKAMGEKVADAVKRAKASAKPATITYGKGRCDLAQNRDYIDKINGKSVCGFNPGGPTDDTVVVGRVTADDGQPVAVIVNYACHPTTLAYENTLISPDFIGSLREVVEPTAGPCVFIQGASGDIGPRHGYVGDTAIADRNGRQLGYAVLSALEAVPPPGQRFAYSGPVVSGATLGRWDYVPSPKERIAATERWQERPVEVKMKYRSDLVRADESKRDYEKWHAAEQAATAKGDHAAARDARAMAERATRHIVRVEYLPAGNEYPYRATLWRIGDAVWLPLEGEHYNILQRRLREQFPNLAVIVGTVANGSFAWYLPDADGYGKGLYQEEVSLVVKGSLERLGDELARVVKDLMSS